MKISEERLREIILGVLQDLEAEKKSLCRQKVYMVCTSPWDEGYCEFLKLMEEFEGIQVYAVIPELWQEKGYESMLRSYESCCEVIYQSHGIPRDIDKAVTVFPVVPKDLVVKTALCISDTFETAWITACIEEGSRVVFLRTGLRKFSGKEPKAYVNQMLSYYRKVLEYGIEINEGSGVAEKGQRETFTETAPIKEKNILPIKSINNKKKVITASNIEEYANNGIVYLNSSDIVTDLAKDKAKFLDIVFKYDV